MQAKFVVSNVVMGSDDSAEIKNENRWILIYFPAAPF